MYFNMFIYLQKTPNTPFRRVKTEDIDVDTRLTDNSFEAKVTVYDI